MVGGECILNLDAKRVEAGCGGCKQKMLKQNGGYAIEAVGGGPHGIEDWTKKPHMHASTMSDEHPQ